jgi:hypothetical protein
VIALSLEIMDDLDYIVLYSLWSAKKTHIPKEPVWQSIDRPLNRTDIPRKKAYIVFSGTQHIEEDAGLNSMKKKALPEQECPDFRGLASNFWCP